MAARSGTLTVDGRTVTLTGLVLDAVLLLANNREDLADMDAGSIEVTFNAQEMRLFPRRKLADSHRTRHGGRLRARLLGGRRRSGHRVDHGERPRLDRNRRVREGTEPGFNRARWSLVLSRAAVGDDAVIPLPPTVPPDQSLALSSVCVRCWFRRNIPRVHAWISKWDLTAAISKWACWQPSQLSLSISCGLVVTHPRTREFEKGEHLDLIGDVNAKYDFINPLNREATIKVLWLPVWLKISDGFEIVRNQMADNVRALWVAYEHTQAGRARKFFHFAHFRLEPCLRIVNPHPIDSAFNPNLREANVIPIPDVHVNWRRVERVSIAWLDRWFDEHESLQWPANRQNAH
jgi:hypothetical protein